MNKGIEITGGCTVEIVDCTFTNDEDYSQLLPNSRGLSDMQWRKPDPVDSKATGIRRVVAWIRSIGTGGD